jgi:hypothetical protein
MLRLPALISLLFFLAACVEPPSSPMEKHARLAAGARLAAQQCAGYAGGYQSAVKLKEDANRNVTIARSLGATDTVLKKASTDVNNAFTTMAAFTSQQEACNSLVGNLAWATT